MAGEGRLEALRGAIKRVEQRASVADQTIDATWFSAVVANWWRRWYCLYGLAFFLQKIVQVRFCRYHVVIKHATPFDDLPAV